MAAARGDVDVALQATRRTVLQSPAFLFNVWGPLMSEVRRQPEFAFLGSELELPAFWQANGWPEHCRPSEPEGFECD
jgi:hypothetical protein